MTFEEKIQSFIDSGDICGRYITPLKNCVSMRDYAELLFDVNGMAFALDMIAENKLDIPYLAYYFEGYLNGSKRISEESYSSEIYVRYKNFINVNSSLLTVVDSDTTIIIPEHRFVTIFSNSRIKVVCPDTSKCYIREWENAITEVKGCTKRVKIEKRKKDAADT